MDTKEYKQLTYSIVPALQEHFKGNKDEVEVKVLQDTLNSQGNPFNPPSIIIGVGYKGVNVMEAFRVSNDGNVCEYHPMGNVQV